MGRAWRRSGEEASQEETRAALNEREVDGMRSKGEALATVRAELGDYLWHPLADFCFFESAAVRRRRAGRARDAARLTQSTLDHARRARAEAVYRAVAGPLTEERYWREGELQRQRRSTGVVEPAPYRRSWNQGFFPLRAGELGWTPSFWESEAGDAALRKRSRWSNSRAS